MHYLLLIFDDPDERARRDAADRAQLFADYQAFTAEIRDSGHFRDANRLEAATTATTVRVRAGKRLITDGPFAETKEHLVGYYLVEAEDLDTAIAIAARIPSARVGSIEVRPVARSG